MKALVTTKNDSTGIIYTDLLEKDIIGNVFDVHTHNENGRPIIIIDEVVSVDEYMQDNERSLPMKALVTTKNDSTGIIYTDLLEKDIIGKVFHVHTHNENGRPIIIIDEVVSVDEYMQDGE